MTRLQEMLQAKQMQLREVLSGGGEGNAGPTPEERQLEQQREEYGRRGIRWTDLCTGEASFAAFVGIPATLVYFDCLWPMYCVHLLCTG